jgi:hypothetical protein
MDNRSHYGLQKHREPDTISPAVRLRVELADDDSIKCHKLIASCCQKLAETLSRWEVRFGYRPHRGELYANKLFTAGDFVHITDDIRAVHFRTDHIDIYKALQAYVTDRGSHLSISFVSGDVGHSMIREIAAFYHNHYQPKESQRTVTHVHFASCETL